MGHGIGYSCSECGEGGMVLLGVGMMFPEVCKEERRKAARGKYGAELQQAVRENPDGWLDCTEVVYACSCGGWENTAVLDYYLPVETKQDSGGYAPPRRNPEDKIIRRKHPCPRCGKNMRPAQKGQSGLYDGLRCRECGGPVVFTDLMMLWD